MSGIAIVIMQVYYLRKPKDLKFFHKRVTSGLPKDIVNIHILVTSILNEQLIIN
jgi:hypothetical protein